MPILKRTDLLSDSRFPKLWAGFANGRTGRSDKASVLPGMLPLADPHQKSGLNLVSEI